MAVYACANENRRALVKGRPGLNGLDFLEVRDDDSMPDALRQRVLTVRYLNALAAPRPGLANFSIQGGERVRNIVVLKVEDGPTPDSQLLTVDRAGDFSAYSLALVRSADDPSPPDGFDPILRAVDFSFKVECPSGFDCAEARPCPPAADPVPEIDYLAKDYASFKRLMLDRMAALMPAWRERNEADPGIALVELLAYAADRLSYRQDAVTTEAHLGTARRRISARRHARLVDYFMHDGANARALVQIRITAAADGLALPGPDAAGLGGTAILSKLPAAAPVIAPGGSELEKALRQAPAVFETMHPLVLRSAHAAIPFYAWGETECCLPAGAVSATLRGSFPDLKAGDLLIFCEMKGPKTGLAQDADPLRRHPVRLTRVEALPDDPLGGLFLDPPQNIPQPVTSIHWNEEDALPFPLCLSGRAEDGSLLKDVSLALGNIVLADHGYTLPAAQDLGPVPAPALRQVLQDGEAACGSPDPEREARAVIPARYRPRLAAGPVTQTARLARVGFRASGAVLGSLGQSLPPTDPSVPAAALWRWDNRDVVPALALVDGEATPWECRRDLFSSDASDPHFVAEVDDDGSTLLRFGDGTHGRRPEAGLAFSARYRIGNGAAGNVGAEALAHAVTALPGVVGARNPLAARGGIDPETLAEVRMRAPQAFRIQKRAVTEADYAAVAQTFPGIQRAAAAFRWTGSWYTVFVTVDPVGGGDVDSGLKADLETYLEGYRMMGHDVKVEGPLYAPLELDMSVCVKADYFRADVEKALRRVFTAGTREDGSPGLFHPDNFSFGDTVYLGPLLAAAQSVEGVSHVEATKFQRQGRDEDRALKAERLTVDRLEIPRLDDDPSFPDRGVFRLTLLGGK